ATKVAESLKNASIAAYQAVLKPIEGTILTVVRESADAAQASAAAGASLAEMLRAARHAGRAALAKTPDMLPVLKDAGVGDAGGAGFLCLLDSGTPVVDADPLPHPEFVDTADHLSGAAFRAVAHRGEGDISDLRYEVMYFVDLPDANIELFKQAWGEIG